MSAPWTGVALVEVGLYASYGAHDARFHWATHFLLGATVALIGMALFSLRAGRPAAYPVLWVLLAHLFAMFPDLLFAAGYPHQWWMELFLLHIRSHFVVGRNLFWLATSLSAFAAYLTLLDQRVRSEA